MRDSHIAELAQILSDIEDSRDELSKAVDQARALREQMAKLQARAAQALQRDLKGCVVAGVTGDY